MRRERKGRRANASVRRPPLTSHVFTYSFAISAKISAFSRLVPGVSST